jgi:hypothetical protein
MGNGSLGSKSSNRVEKARRTESRWRSSNTTNADIVLAFESERPRSPAQVAPPIQLYLDYGTTTYNPKKHGSTAAFRKKTCNSRL